MSLRKVWCSAVFPHPTLRKRNELSRLGKPAGPEGAEWARHSGMCADYSPDIAPSDDGASLVVVRAGTRRAGRSVEMPRRSRGPAVCALLGCDLTHPGRTRRREKENNSHDAARVFGWNEENAGESCSVR